MTLKEQWRQRWRKGCSLSTYCMYDSDDRQWRQKSASNRLTRRIALTFRSSDFARRHWRRRTRPESGIWWPSQTGLWIWANMTASGMPQKLSSLGSSRRRSTARNNTTLHYWYSTRNMFDNYLPEENSNRFNVSHNKSFLDRYHWLQLVIWHPDIWQTISVWYLSTGCQLRISKCLPIQRCFAWNLLYKELKQWVCVLLS